MFLVGGNSFWVLCSWIIIGLTNCRFTRSLLVEFGSFGSGERDLSFSGAIISFSIWGKTFRS